MVQQVVAQRHRRDDRVLHAAHQRQLEHGLGVRHERHEYARRVDQVDGLGALVGVGLDDLDAAGDLARHAGLGAREGRLGLVHAGHAQRVEQRRLADVGHADDHDARAEQRGVVRAVVFGEVEDRLDVALRFVVAEERGVRVVPAADDVFSLCGRGSLAYIPA